MYTVYVYKTNLKHFSIIFQTKSLALYVLLNNIDNKEWKIQLCIIKKLRGDGEGGRGRGTGGKSADPLLELFSWRCCHLPERRKQNKGEKKVYLTKIGKDFDWCLDLCF